MKVANQAHFCIRQFHGRGLTRLSMPNRARLCSVVPRGGRDIESAFAFSTFGSQALSGPSRQRYLPIYPATSGLYCTIDTVIPSFAKSALIFCGSRHPLLFENHPHNNLHARFNSSPSMVCQLGGSSALVNAKIIKSLLHIPSLNSSFNRVALQQVCEYQIELLENLMINLPRDVCALARRT